MGWMRHVLSAVRVAFRCALCCALSLSLSLSLSPTECSVFENLHQWCRNGVDSYTNGVGMV